MRSFRAFVFQHVVNWRSCHP